MIGKILSRHARKAIIAFAFLTASGSALAQTSDAEAPSAAIEPGALMCPVMPDEPIDSNFTTKYKGRTVYLCCRRCLSKFKADPESFADKLVEVQPVSDQEIEVAPVLEEDEPVVSPEAPEIDPPAPASTANTTPATSEFNWIAYAGRFHILAVHFPIALLSVAAFFEFLGFFSRSRVEPIIRATVAIGALGALTAMALGLMNATENTFTGDLSSIFWWHRALGILTTAAALVAWVAVERCARKATPGRVSSARLAVFASAILVAAAGHFGGSLVFGWTYLLP